MNQHMNQQPFQQLQLRSIDETMPTLRISRSTMWRHLKRGSIRSVRIGKKVFIAESEIARILKEGLPMVFGVAATQKSQSK